MADESMRRGFTQVKSLRMYYEIRGEGQPLVVLHGSFMTIELMGALIPGLAQTRQVIAFELQGHGRTADVDRPFSYEQLANDVAAAITQLGYARVDLYGYSLGGGVALQLAIRHPELVRKLVLVGSSYTSDGMYSEVLAGIAQITPAVFDGTPWREAFDRVAPNPSAFPSLVAKLVELDKQPFAWPADAVRAVAAPTLVVIGDSDGTTPEHAVELFRLRGGGVFGDMVGLPASQLAILPGTTHVGLLDRAVWLVPMVKAFLDSPVPARR